MAEGNSTYMGLAVPLVGEAEIKQQTAATDILTLSAASGASGDFLVCQTVGGGEVFVVGAAGEVTAKGAITATGMTLTSALNSTGDIAMAANDIAVRVISFGTAGAPTTAPTTLITKGDMFIVWKSATAPVLGMCVSAATKLVQYIAAFDAGTLGIPS